MRRNMGAGYWESRSWDTELKGTPGFWLTDARDVGRIRVDHRLDILLWSLINFPNVSCTKRLIRIGLACYRAERTASTSNRANLTLNQLKEYYERNNYRISGFM